jgi:phospholipid/cholesterol/gamma-HCH transport system ATP-binding protein
MITVHHIRKSFGDKVVLQDVSAKMEAGKCNLIIGASGSGKTVFIKCLVGLIVPEQGEVLYDGKDFLKMDAEEKKEIRKQIGMLFQGSALFDSLTVEENIMFPLNMFTSDGYQKKLQRVNEVLERVNLAGVNKKYPAEESRYRKGYCAEPQILVLR